MNQKIKDAIRWVCIKIVGKYILDQIACGKMSGGWSEYQIEEMATKHVDTYMGEYVA